MVRNAWSRSRLRCFAATPSCSCACWSAKPPGCRGDAISCAFIAHSRRAARSEVGALFRASLASSLHCQSGSRLRAVRRRACDHGLVSVSDADPLNLAGILTPGPKLAALVGNRVLYRDGIPIALLEGDSTRFLEPVEPKIKKPRASSLSSRAHALFRWLPSKRGRSTKPVNPQTLSTASTQSGQAKSRTI